MLIGNYSPDSKGKNGLIIRPEIMSSFYMGGMCIGFEISDPKHTKFLKEDHSRPRSRFSPILDKPICNLSNLSYN